MGGIGQNLQLQSDSSEIVCGIIIRAPHTTYVVFCELREKMSMPELKIWVYIEINVKIHFIALIKYYINDIFGIIYSMAPVKTQL